MNRNKRIRNAVRLVAFLASLVCVPVMAMLVGSNSRTYGFCQMGFYEKNLWWQVAVLFVAVCYLVATVCRRSRHIEQIVLMLAGAGSLAVCATSMAKSGNILVYTVDRIIGNADAPFAFIFMMMVVGAGAFMLLAAIGFLGAKKPIRF